MTTEAPAHDPATTTDANEGEGSASAAIAYNDAATAFARDPAQVLEAAQAAAASEPGPFVRFPSGDPPPMQAASIEVTFDGAGWRIHDPTSPDEPVFLKLQDAEQRASVLARETGRGVCVRDQGGDVVAMYAAAPPA